MKGSSLGYLLKTGFKNVYMNRLMSFASIGVLVACLMLIGSAVLLSLNMQVIVGAVEDENEMVAFLDMDLSDSQIQQIGNEISRLMFFALLLYEISSLNLSIQIKTTAWMFDIDISQQIRYKIIFLM